MISKDLALQLTQVLSSVLLFGLGLIDRVACSSSLVALHLACNAIRAGDARMAIIGGSNLILTQEPIVDLSTLRYIQADNLTGTPQPC